MNNIPESTLNILLSSFMGFFGGLATTPINAIFASWLKRDELLLKHKLDKAAKKQELYYEHKLEMQRKAKDDELKELYQRLNNLEKRINNDD